jgi:membrane-bound serine protease (ClpP class)
MISNIKDSVSAQISHRAGGPEILIANLRLPIEYRAANPIVNRQFLGICNSGYECAICASPWIFVFVLYTAVMEPKVWSLLLCVLMMAATVLELLTPMMGGFTLAALAAAVGSVLVAFQASDSFGYVMIAANLLLFPSVLALGLHFLKRSPLMLHQELKSGAPTSSDSAVLANLAGQQGVALTPLRPGGSAMINNVKIDVVAEGKFVEANTPVKVLRVEGNRVLVEPIPQ